MIVICLSPYKHTEGQAYEYMCAELLKKDTHKEMSKEQGNDITSK